MGQEDGMKKKEWQITEHLDNIFYSLLVSKEWRGELLNVCKVMGERLGERSTVEEMGLFVEHGSKFLTYYILGNCSGNVNLLHTDVIKKKMLEDMRLSGIKGGRNVITFFVENYIPSRDFMKYIDISGWVGDLFDVENVDWDPKTYLRIKTHYYVYDRGLEGGKVRLGRDLIWRLYSSFNLYLGGASYWSKDMEVYAGSGLVTKKETLESVDGDDLDMDRVTSTLERYFELLGEYLTSLVASVIPQHFNEFIQFLGEGEPYLFMGSRTFTSMFVFFGIARNSLEGMLGKGGMSDILILSTLERIGFYFYFKVSGVRRGIGEGEGEADVVLTFSSRDLRGGGLGLARGLESVSSFRGELKIQARVKARYRLLGGGGMEITGFSLDGGVEVGGGRYRKVIFPVLGTGLEPDRTEKGGSIRDSVEYLGRVRSLARDTVGAIKGEILEKLGKGGKGDLGTDVEGELLSDVMVRVLEDGVRRAL